VIFVLELLFHTLYLALFEDGGLRCAGRHDAAHVGVVFIIMQGQMLCGFILYRLLECFVSSQLLIIFAIKANYVWLYNFKLAYS
jgi:hypothetical protein